MKKLYILVIMFLTVLSPTWAQIRDFQTTRLHSTAGAGVASVLSTEAAILNPATAAYFEGSSISYHSVSTSLRHKNEQRAMANDDFADSNKSKGAFVADHSGPVKGGFSWIDQDENEYARTQYIMHGAAPTGEGSSLGFAYRYLQDTRPKKFGKRHLIRHQMSLGSLHVLDDKTQFGILLIDPTRSTVDEERAIAGIQYQLADKIALIGDLGSQFTKDVKKRHLWRAAAQLTLFSDFFLRAGKFYDNVREVKGTGWGVGWIGPRLGVEFGQKFSDQFGRNSYIYKDETLVDTSLSAVIKF